MISIIKWYPLSNKCKWAAAHKWQRSLRQTCSGSRQPLELPETENIQSRLLTIIVGVLWTNNGAMGPSQRDREVSDGLELVCIAFLHPSNQSLKLTSSTSSSTNSPPMGIESGERLTRFLEWTSYSQLLTYNWSAVGLHTNSRVNYSNNSPKGAAFVNQELMYGYPGCHHMSTFQ